MEENVIKIVVDQVDIVDVISNYIDLKKSGRNYVGICPFHDDTNPSLTVNREKKLFKCFVCGAGGNVITFVMKIENCGFKEAFNKVVELGGLSNDLKMKITQEFTYNPYNEKQRRQIKMNEIIQEYLSYNIKTANAEGSYEYLTNRGISDEAQKRFGLGYMHDVHLVIRFLQQKCGFTREEIAENDFFRINDFGIYSPYEHRITIPIYDRFHYLIGFAGRKGQYETKLDAKYINPSTTDLFHKGRILFNHYNAVHESKSKKEIYVVEGYMDAIAMDANGYPNTVAIMGTAMTHEQIEYLKQIKSEVVIVLDGDGAGQRAMFSIYRQCVKEGLDASFAVLPDGKDPDDMLRTQKAEMDRILANYMYGYEFAASYCYDPAMSFRRQKELIMEMMDDFIHQERDVLDRSHFFHLIQESYGLDVESIRETYQLCQQKIQTKKAADRKMADRTFTPEIPMKKGRVNEG
ncbi:DNA primase [Massilimicrobiota sp. An80]|uniref:DNA primase n=1 Tax=Bacillota TaxID=1239 RepID=UPI0007A7FA2C|nr:DNA primase [Massilimicrobiota sp. An80]OUN37970.1 DNA primase [Massilimicrobiota sp. An80]CVH76636.1 DNA primase [Clostridiales bacterium CHKCI006]